jgi:hypothetical protein
MNTSRTALNLVALISLSAVALLFVRQHRLPAAAAPATPVAMAAEAAPVEAQPTTAIRTAAVAGKVPAAAPAATTAATPVPGAPDLKDDVELAYQVGEDITRLSPEARARMRADWAAHLAQVHSEATAAQ